MPKDYVIVGVTITVLGGRVIQDKQCIFHEVARARLRKILGSLFYYECNECDG